MYIGYRDDGLMELSWLRWSHSASLETRTCKNLSTLEAQFAPLGLA